VNFEPTSLNKNEIAFDENSLYHHRFGDGSIPDASALDLGSTKK